MSDGAHLLIPFASCLAPASRERLAAIALPNLARLLAVLRMGERIAGDEHTLSMPHEKLLAAACGLPQDDGRIPWAAREARSSGLATGAWAWITPCHWRVGSDHVAMDVVSGLRLDEDQSRALLEAMRPYFEEDGIALEYRAPTAWLARGDVFAHLPAASLDRVEGRVIDDWMPRTPSTAALRRLQQEMQMLLYTHPVNDARLARGLLPVTSFWASGTGALGEIAPRTAAEAPQVADALREPALREDWDAWSSAWQTLDASECASLLEQFAAGRHVKLTLAGERSAQSWTSDGARSWRHRLAGLVTRVQPAAQLATL